MEESELNQYEDEPKEEPITLVKLLNEYAIHNRNYGYYSFEVNRQESMEDNIYSEEDDIYFSKLCLKQCRAEESARNIFNKIIDYLILGEKQRT